MSRFSKALRSRPSDPRDEILDDVASYYRDLLGMRITPPERQFDSYGRPNAWLDVTPGSACMERIKFWRDSWKIHKETGKSIFMRLEPRDSGKSATMQAEALRIILKDPDFTLKYCAQNTVRAAERSAWMRSKLLSQPIQSRWGYLKSNDWSKTQFTVANRPRGMGECSTVEVFGPGKSITGGHPRLFIFDDVVDSKNSLSSLMQNAVFSSWNDVLQAADRDTLIWIIGTWWRGIYHLYDLIADKFEKDAEIVVVPWQGIATDVRGNKVFSGTGKQNYPWITPEYIETKRRTLPEPEFVGAYLNTKASDKMLFKLGMFHQKNPPVIAARRNEPFSGFTIDRNQCILYMITDPANNKGDQKHSSKAALAVIAKHFCGDAYVLDMACDYMQSDTFLDTMLSMWQRWSPIVYYSMETQGPGNMYPGWITDRFKLKGVQEPVLRPISRWGQSKESRIETLHQPMVESKLYFATTVPSKMIRWDTQSNLPTGEIPEEAARFNPAGNKESLDGLDCLADAFWADKDGPICPSPTPPAGWYDKRLTPEEIQAETWRKRLEESGFYDGGEQTALVL